MLKVQIDILGTNVTNAYQTTEYQTKKNKDIKVAKRHEDNCIVYIHLVNGPIIIIIIIAEN